jgi:sialidase-1
VSFILNAAKDLIRSVHPSEILRGDQDDGFQTQDLFLGHPLCSGEHKMSMLRGMLIGLVVGIAILGVAQDQAFAAVIGFWDFSQMTPGDTADIGDVITDSSGNGHTGTVVGGAMATSLIYTAGDPRFGGSSLDFPAFVANGTHIELAPNACYQFNGHDSFTLEADVKIPVHGEPQGMYFQVAGSGGSEWWLRNHASSGDSNRGELLVYDGAHAANFKTVAGMNDGAWHHLAMVYDGAAGTAKLYEDYVLSNQRTGLAITGVIGSSTNKPHIGQTLAGTNVLQGDIAFLRLSSGALAPSKFFGAPGFGWLDQEVLFRGDSADGYPNVRIPALAVTPQGTLLAFCEGRQGGDFGNVDLILKRSTNGGKDWTSAQVVRDDGANTIGNACPIVDRTTGEILLLHNRNDQAATETSIIQGLDKREVWITKSIDEGVYWSTTPTQITGAVSPPNTAWQSVGPVNGIQLTGQAHTGRLVAPCTRTEIGVDFGAPGAWLGYSAYSDDHGATWHYGADTVDADENSMVELADGQVMMVARRDTSMIPSDPHYRVATSNDQGETWSATQVQPDLPTWSCQGSVLRYTLATDYGKNRLLFAGPASTTDRSHFTIYLSYDEGQTWPVSKLLTSDYGGYSSLAVLPDMTIACLYETAWTSTITLARFDLAWLTNGADTLQSPEPGTFTLVVIAIGLLGLAAIVRRRR